MDGFGLGSRHWVLHRLREMRGLVFDFHGEEELDLRIPPGPWTRFRVQTKRNFSKEAARSLAETPSGKIKRLLAVDRLAPATRELLREVDISWMERETGVCFLYGAGLLIDRRPEEQTQRPPKTVPTKLRDRTGLVAEAILEMDTHAHIRVDETSRKAGVSSALVSRVFRRLTELELLQENDVGPSRFWKLRDFGALLDLWAREERNEVEQTGLYVWSESPRALYEKLSRIGSLDAQWAMAGVAAANLYAPTLTQYPDPILRLDAGVPAAQMAKALDGEVVREGGNVSVWQTPGNIALLHIGYGGDLSLPFGADLPKLTRPRAYIESVFAPGRAPDVAERLRERMIADRA